MRLYLIERSNWFGECEVVEDGLTFTQATRKQKTLQRASEANDDADDRIVYSVHPCDGGLTSGETAQANQ